LSEYRLEMCDVVKTFPGVKALNHAQLKLRPGAVHALMGENGAGKSTLIKVLTGVEEFETGEIMIDGCDHPIIHRNPQEAQKHGISTVYQEVNLCPNLSVAENLFIGREPRKGGLIDWKTMNKRAAELLADLDIHADVTQTIDNYSIAIQQMIAIARAVDMSAKVLILDEPTSILTRKEKNMLFNEAVICITKYSIAHTKARKQTEEKGITFLSMPDYNMEILKNPAFTVDYKSILPRVRRYAENVPCLHEHMRRISYDEQRE